MYDNEGRSNQLDVNFKHVWNLLLREVGVKFIDDMPTFLIHIGEISKAETNEK